MHTACFGVFIDDRGVESDRMMAVPVVFGETFVFGALGGGGGTQAQFARGSLGAKKCPEGYAPILNRAQCRSALLALKNGNDGVSSVATWGHRPIGCFQHNPNKYYHFNSRTTGVTTSTDDYAICVSSRFQMVAVDKFGTMTDRRSSSAIASRFGSTQKPLTWEAWNASDTDTGGNYKVKDVMCGEQTDRGPMENERTSEREPERK